MPVVDWNYGPFGLVEHIWDAVVVARVFSSWLRWFEGDVEVEGLRAGHGVVEDLLEELVWQGVDGGGSRGACAAEVGGYVVEDGLEKHFWLRGNW